MHQRGLAEHDHLADRREPGSAVSAGSMPLGIPRSIPEAALTGSSP